MIPWTWDDAHVCAFDFETSGSKPEYALQPWRLPKGDFWATSLAWVWPGGVGLAAGGGLDPTVAQMRGFLEWAIATDRRVWGWNTIYDISVLIAYGLEDLVNKVKWGDAMLLWRHWEIEPEYDEKGPKRSYRLKAWVREFLPEHAGYEDAIDFHDTSPEARAKLHDYNVRDNCFTLRAAKWFWARLTPRQQRAALIEMDCLPAVAAANLRGLVIDTLAASDLKLRLQTQAADCLAQLQSQGVTEEIVRSPTKLAVLLFDEWKLPVFKMNPHTAAQKEKGKPASRSTDKEVLHELSIGDPRVKLLRSYREALNQATKFADGPMDAVAYCNDHGRCHPLARVFGTYSSRFTYSSKQTVEVVRTFKRAPPKVVEQELPVGFALHQMKRGPDFRSLIVAPPGFTLVEFDASGQEFRWMAIASGDVTMLELCMPGEDPHSFMGNRIDPAFSYKDLMRLVGEADSLDKVLLGPDHKHAKNTRQGGKVSNLSLQYRTSPPRLMTTARVDYGMDMTLNQAEHNHLIYRRTYRGVPEYWKSQISLTKQLGYVETFAGRRVQVVGDWGGRFGWGMGSTAINYRIQGTGGDQKYLAMSVLKDYCTEIGAHFLFDMHDGLYFLVPDARLMQFATRVKHMLDNLPYEKAWGFTPTIPMPWDCKAGRTWGTMKGVKL